MFRWKRREKNYVNQKISEYDQKITTKTIDELKKIPISISLEENKEILKWILKDCSDLVYRSFVIRDTNLNATLVFVKNLVDQKQIDQSILFPLMIEESKVRSIEDLLENRLQISDLTIVDNMGELIKKILDGNAILLIHNYDRSMAIPCTHTEYRKIEEPDTDSVLRGSREGFTEKIDVNLSMVRRRLKTPRLKVYSQRIGSETQTQLTITYLEGIAKKTLIEELKARLNKIEIDGILESSYIEELIKDDSWSVFPQFLNTERPDRVVAALLEGRVAIFVDGTPFVLVAPITFWSLMQSAEDYYESWMITSLFRLIRFGLVILALLGPAYYIALTTYHVQMIPTELVFSIAAAREVIPFPAAMESLLIELVFEALREAGIRMPKNIGQTISILGAIVIGLAAVEAGIVSAIAVITVAITGIASFSIPRFNLSNSIRFLRFPFMILAAALGIYGIFLGMAILLGHLIQMRSFGIPYFYPIDTTHSNEWQDAIIRVPIIKNIKRPSDIAKEDQARLDLDLEHRIEQERGMKHVQEDH